MSYKEIAHSAADWALQQVGSPYSQAKRTQKGIFDCSSLVARAYTEQGKRWKYGGSVPTSNKEIYDDEFALLWPATYAEIGKKFGNKAVISLATQPGDLQFLCTDSDTGRANKITHVTMVTSPTKIVHARSTKYGVRTDSITLYAGKVCGVVRYNPACVLRTGMKGFRTLRLQQALNQHGAEIAEDGEFGFATRTALTAFQKSKRLNETGETNVQTLTALGLDAEAKPISEPPATQESIKNKVLIMGASVHVRSGPGKKFPSIAIAHKGDAFEGVETDGWAPLLLDGEIRWASERYCVRISEIS